MITKQYEKWSSSFGDEYTERNMPDDATIQNRMSFWTGNIGILPAIPNSILEVGCNVGSNLIAIDNMYQIVGEKRPEIFYNEINLKARQIIKEQNPHFKDVAGDASFLHMDNAQADLVITCGLLIHIRPDSLKDVMKEIYRVSRRYIICAEYFSAEPREVRYRGQDDMLWTRDFGSEWLDNFKLRCISYNFAWKRITKMDNLTTWIFEKVH